MVHVANSAYVMLMFAHTNYVLGFFGGSRVMSILEHETWPFHFTHSPSEPLTSLSESLHIDDNFSETASMQNSRVGRSTSD